MLTRRGVIAAVPLVWVPRLAAAALAPTPAQTAGPFYPRQKPLDQDDDLTAVHGHAGRARGETILVRGSVRDAEGRPVFGATVEIWQANAAGRYDHPADRNPAALDPDFQGFGKALTDAAGGFRFRTVKPGPYADRTPHIHVQMRGPNRSLVTQMYFPGEARNLRDPLFDPALLLTPLASAGDGSAAYRFDFVLGA